MILDSVIGVLFIFTNALKAMRKAMLSLILSVSKQVLILIALLFMLKSLGGFSGSVYSKSIMGFDMFLIILSFNKKPNKGVISNYSEITSLFFSSMFFYS